MTYRQVARTAPFFIALLTLSTLALKSEPTGQLYDGADKLYHWVGFSVLLFTAHLAFPRVRLTSLCLWAVIGAASIELLQLLSVDRTASLDDMLVNLVGILTGLGATFLLPRQAPVARQDRHPEGASRQRRRRRVRIEPTAQEPT